MKLEEIRAEGRIPPEAGLCAYEETGTIPAPDRAHRGIAAVAKREASGLALRDRAPSLSVLRAMALSLRRPRG